LAEEERDKLERHVQQSIDHAVGTLPKLSEQAPQSMSGAIDRSETVRDLIRDPKTLRAALIVSEILKRPKW
jgi:putative ubiquitin-RnfH superfamily antitoxin RatB of RatAB toxin-antitoxin module